MRKRCGCHDGYVRTEETWQDRRLTVIVLVCWGNASWYFKGLNVPGEHWITGRFGLIYIPKSRFAQVLSQEDCLRVLGTFVFYFWMEIFVCPVYSPLPERFTLTVGREAVNSCLLYLHILLLNLSVSYNVCSSGRTQTWDSPASASQELGLLACTASPVRCLYLEHGECR